MSICCAGSFSTFWTTPFDTRRREAESRLRWKAPNPARGFASPNHSTGVSYSYRFKAKGTYEYLCTIPGHAAGGMKGGRHVRFTRATPLANLHLTLLDKVGVRLDKFGDSNGKVDGLFEPVGI